MLFIHPISTSMAKQTRNSAEKSSLIEIINFVFGADSGKGAFYNKEVFQDDLFCVELAYNDTSFIVSRGASKKAVFTSLNE